MIEQQEPTPWEDAPMEERFKWALVDYDRALLKAANNTFCEECEGIFSGESEMNYHWAQDAVQDAMLDAYRFLLEHPERDIHHPKGWLRTITRRAASRLMKRFYLKDGSRAVNQGAVETLSDKPLEALSACLAELNPVFDRDQMDYLEALVEKREREKELHEVMDALLTKEEVFLINKREIC